MKRFLIATGCLLIAGAVGLAPTSASAQGGDKGADKKAGGDKKQPDDGLGAPPDLPKDDTPKKKAAPAPPPPTLPNDNKRSGRGTVLDAAGKKERKSWQDIVVLPRKGFLKRRRVDLTAFVGTTINDSLIQHTAIGGELSYHITDALSVSVLGVFYIGNVLDQEFFTRYQFQLVPTLNRYLYTVTGNMAYVPIHGKFAIFNKWIWHYEVFVTGGAGITGTEIIPRNAEHEAWTNIALTFPIGMGGRMFITKWLAVSVTIRDFMMLDRFEPPGRTAVLAADVKDDAETRFINNIVFQLGVSVYFPLSFKYTTFR
ncbi:MAG: outer membrane beta-barrel domain-containing protein [Myxococcales bacterium]|nr:outer membrane beta-barrel domain-containing protein [Myxococcales bacterium]